MLYCFLPSYTIIYKVILENMAQRCHCHGASGSCTTQVCSTALPAFRQVGNVLKQKFDAAVQVKLQYIGTRKALIPIKERSPEITSMDLVYLKASPLRSHCGSVRGRRCRDKPDRSGSCDVMCCNKGYWSEKRIIVKACKCKFKWCCEVKCERCRYTVEIHRCK